MHNNNFMRYLKQEDWTHKGVSEWLALTHPDLLWWHTPNEGRRTPFECFKMKWLGARSGVSDFIMIHHGRMLALEMKTLYVVSAKACRRSAVQESQKDFLAKVEAAGGTAAIAWTVEEAMEIITKWLTSD